MFFVFQFGGDLVAIGLRTRWLFTSFVVLMSLNRGRYEFSPSRVPRTVEGTQH